MADRGRRVDCHHHRHGRHGAVLVEVGTSGCGGSDQVFPPDSGGLCTSGVGVSIRADDEWINEFAIVEAQAEQDVVARVESENRRYETSDEGVGAPLEPACELFFSAEVPDAKSYWVSIDGVGTDSGEGARYSASDLDDSSNVVFQGVTEGRPISVREAGMTEGSTLDMLRLAKDQCRSLEPDGAGEIMSLADDALTIAATASSDGAEFAVFECVLGVLNADTDVLFEFWEGTRQFDGIHLAELPYQLDVNWEWSDTFRASVRRYWPVVPG